MALNLTTPYDTLRYEFHALKKTSSNYLSSDLVAALASLHMNDFPHGLTKNWSKSWKLKSEVC